VNGSPNLSTLLFDHPFPDGEGLLHTSARTVTAGESRSMAVSTAEQLSGSGVSAGEAVVVQLPNSPEAVTSMMGVWRAGSVFVPLNPRAAKPEVQRVLETLRPAALIGPDGVELFDAPARYDGGVGFVLWSSGTTGAPKPILHTHEAYFEIIDRVLGRLKSGAAPRSERPSPNLIPVSLTLNAGIYNTLFGLRAGAEIVIMDRFDTRDFAGLVSRFAIRSTVLPPAAIAMLNADESITDLRPLKYVRSITAPLSPVQARVFSDRFGVFVLNSYGQAELGEVIGWTAEDARTHPEKLGAAGKPHPGVGVRVDDTGRLWVKPPSRAAGYAGGEDLGERVDSAGFVDTGDLARIDEDDFVWIEGRADDLINRGGNKVHPAEVEEVIRMAPGIGDVAVVAEPDDRLGQVPVAFYEGKHQPDSTLDELCRANLVAYKVPVRFEWVEALPRSEVGKVLKVALASPGERQSTASEPAPESRFRENSLPRDQESSGA
jgi:acyl-coenzyme A synthetase/AMP-(fatty) acid ligase